jgi:hypothetical protein
MEFSFGNLTWMRCENVMEDNEAFAIEMVAGGPPTKGSSRSHSKSDHTSHNASGAYVSVIGIDWVYSV